ncbi:hypothetical protein FU976_07985 [Campylobacter jejuni]|nr:hypothetical protein [Campylobacter jejuni]
MAATPTKILAYDLDADLIKIIDDLKRLQGAFPSLYERLTKIGTDLMDADTKRVVEDLHKGYQKTSKLTIKRLEDLEFLLMVALTDAQDGSEEFTYDEIYQNVTKHLVKNAAGATLFTIDYNYADLPTGKLSYSEKKFKDAELNDVVVKKVYTYDANENIKSIATTTTKTPPAPAQAP